MKLSIKPAQYALLGISLLFSINASCSPYNIGAGIYDVTDPSISGFKPGPQLSNGIHQRSRSRAFVMESIETGNRVVFTSIDIGEIYQDVKSEVIRQLKKTHGNLYSHDNVMLSANHAHQTEAVNGLVTPSAKEHSQQNKYSINGFNIVVSGIVESINRAHHNLAPGSIELIQGELIGATINSSPNTYNMNSDSQEFNSNTNNMMSVLKFEKDNGTEVGMINWFAVQPIISDGTKPLMSGSNKGYAQYKFGQLKGTDFSSKETFVAAFANSDEGDAIPIESPFLPTNQSNFEHSGSESFLRPAESSGKRQFEKGLELYHSQGSFLDGRIDYRHRWVDLKYYRLASNTEQNQQAVCRIHRNDLTSPNNNTHAVEDIDDMNNYDILNYITGELDDSQSDTLLTSTNAEPIPNPIETCQRRTIDATYTKHQDSFSEIVPFQLFVIGDLALIGMPGDASTMAGRRIRSDILETLRLKGVQTAIIAGHTNAYSQYLNTPEEYLSQAQNPLTSSLAHHALPIYRNEFAFLASAIQTDRQVVNDAIPQKRFYTHQHIEKKVAFDNKPWQEQFGQVIKNANEKYRYGQEVKVTFRGANPTNNLRIQDSFLEIQKKVGWKWETISYDWDWDTTYEWKQDKLANTTVDITWRIPKDVETGTYRVVHRGDWKSGWSGKLTEYTGTSRRFAVF